MISISAPRSVARSVLLAAAALAFVLVTPVASAHSLGDVEGSIEVGPPGARPGATAEVRVRLRPLKSGATDGLHVRVQLEAGGENVAVPMQREAEDVFAGQLTLKEGTHDVRVVLDRGGTTQFALTGFLVAPTLQPLGPGEESALWFVPRGRLDAIPWLDNLSGLLAAIAALIAAFVLWRRPRSPPTGQVSGSARPLLAATLGALSMPLGAYWDIAFHSESGRESFFSPPHLLIYGGILVTMGAVVLGVGRKAPGATWHDHLRGKPAARAAAIALTVQLASAPFDELWHALFGLDVSIWSPPHALLIGGGVAVCLALALIDATGTRRLLVACRTLTLAGALLIVQVFLAESEFPFPAWHVSQRRPAFVYPLLLVLFTVVIALVARRALRGRWAGLGVALTTLTLRLAVYPLLMLVGRNVLPRFSLWLLLVPVVAAAVDLLAQRRDARAPAPITRAGETVRLDIPST